MSRRQRVALIVLVALVALAASIAIGSSIISEPPSIARDERPTPTSTPRAAPSAVPEGLVKFEEPEGGFSILYPATWKRLEATNPEVRLLAGDGADFSLLVRVAPSGLDVTPQTLGIAQGLTDRLVRADRRVRVRSTEAITLDDVPGYRYTYTFTADPDGARGAHVHYFLFRRRRLIQLVYQVPGAGALKRDSALLDRLAATFRAVG